MPITLKGKQVACGLCLVAILTPNMPSFPVANTGSLDVQLWIHARFVQEGRGEGHVAPQGASEEVAKPKTMQTCD
jgi:hypothetical protein